MKAIVLAAGFGTRMYPLTRERAKPLLEVGGRPILDHILERVLELPGLASITVVANHRFAAALGRWCAACAAPIHIPVQIVDDGATDDEQRLGAVADLALGLAQAGDPDRDGYLVVAGDNLFRFDLRPLAARFRGTLEPLLVMRQIEGEVPPRRYGEIEVDAAGRVTSFREKPADPRSHLAATGIYFFPAELPELVAEYLAGGGEPDAPGHFVEWLVARRPVHAVHIAGPWYDIGDRASYERARRAFEGGPPQA